MFHRFVKYASVAAFCLSAVAATAVAEDAVVVPQPVVVPAPHVVQPGVPVGLISAEDAMQIALGQTGGGTVVEFEMDRKRDGRVEYEIEVLTDTRKYEFEIDGYTGAILKYKEKTPKHLRKIYKYN